MSYFTQKQVIARLTEEQGARSIRAFALEVGVSAGYLYDVLKGKRNIGPKICAYLQLEERRETVVTYYPAQKGKQ